jgi:hypothetical protein
VSCRTRYAAPVRSLLAILATCIGLVGCDDHGAKALTAIKTKVCACKTASCAEQEMKQVPQREIASNHRTQGIARDMLDCFAKLQAGERPSTDPDEEGAATTGAATTGAATAPAPAPAPAASMPAASAAPHATATSKPAAAAPPATKTTKKKR